VKPHIRLILESVPNDSVDTYRIAEQTLRCDEFNRSLANLPEMPMILRSSTLPAIEGPTFYVRGTNAEMDARTFRLSPRLYEAVVETVVAYNQMFSKNKISSTDVVRGN
jgi:hypothetical protein